MELCIQLGIIMIGKQAVNTALEMAIPIFYKWLNSLKVRIGKQRNQSLKSKGQRFVKDLKLVEWGSRGLFPEYLEMGKYSGINTTYFYKHFFFIFSATIWLCYNFRCGFPTGTVFRINEQHSRNAT